MRVAVSVSERSGSVAVQALAAGREEEQLGALRRLGAANETLRWTVVDVPDHLDGRAALAYAEERAR